MKLRSMIVAAALGVTTGAVLANEPTPSAGRLDGTTAFLTQTDTPKKATKSHPEWFRGTGENGLADENAKYFYHELIGPNLPAPAFQNEHVYFGPLEMKPGYTYPAHNHPAPEIYYVIEGEAEWHVDDEVKKVGPGDLIYHRPYAAHGWTVTSDTPLKAVWLWWSEGDTSVLNQSAKMTNPDLASKEETAKASADPVPAVRKK